MSASSQDDFDLDKQGFLQVAFSCISFGIHMSIGFAVLYLHLKAPRGKRVPWIWFAHVLSLMTCGTIIVAATIQPIMKSFVFHRNFPGGPMAFLEAINDPVEILSDTAYSLAIILADIMLLYRLKIIWGNRWQIIVVPFLAYLTEIALSILTLFQSARPGASIWTQSAVNVLVPYWSLGIANNAFMTLLIVYRMLSFRYKVANSLGPGHLKLYLSISAIIVESSALYTIFGIIFVALFARNSPVQFPFAGIFDQVSCISSELIVMRVVLGRAWSQKTNTIISKSTSISEAPTQENRDGELSAIVYANHDTSLGDGTTTESTQNSAKHKDGRDLV